MLICPYTGARLKRARIKGGFLWYSPESGGRLLALPMVRHYLGQEAAQELWMRSEKAKYNPDRPCPSCAKAMRLVSEPSWIGPWEIDVCRRCYMIWFDQYEHMEIPHPHVDLDPNVQETEKKVAHLEVAADQERHNDELSHVFGEGPESILKQVAALFMLPVKMESPAEPRFPVMTAMIAVGMLFVAFFWGFGEELVRDFAFVPAVPFKDYGLRMFSGALAHGDLIHLLGNWYFFGMFGDDVEEDLGSGTFLLFVAVTLVGVALSLSALTLRPELPVIGASGLIFALMSFYALRFPKVRMAYLVPMVHHLSLQNGAWARLQGMRWIRLPVWAVMIFYIGFNVLAHFLLERRGLTHVSYLSHMAGAGMGVILYILFGRSARKD